MLGRCLLLFALAGGWFFSLGCQHQTDGPAAQSEYKPPGRGAETAVIQGMRRRMGFLADDHLGYILLVDRKFISNARRGWDKPIVLEAGKRTLTAEYTYGPFTARADIVLEVKPGASYQLRIMNGTEGADGSRFNDFWIVDASGRVVSQVQHAPISGGNSNYNPFSVN
jgi:hypothetical protein